MAVNTKSNESIISILNSATNESAFKRLQDDHDSRGKLPSRTKSNSGFYESSKFAGADDTTILPPVAKIAKLESNSERAYQQNGWTPNNHTPPSDQIITTSSSFHSSTITHNNDFNHLNNFVDSSSTISKDLTSVEATTTTIRENGSTLPASFNVPYPLPKSNCLLTIPPKGFIFNFIDVIVIS